MEEWQENEKLFLIPLNWHGEDGDPSNDDDDTTDDAPDDKKDISDSKSDKNKKSDTTKKSTKTKKNADDLDDDDIPDTLPEDVDSLSAQELRELLRTQSKELKKATLTARKRLREIMEKKEKFKEIEAEKEAARLKELEEKEEYKKLYETIKPKYDVLVGDTGKTHAFFEKQLEKLMEDLPEDYQKLVPEVDVRSRIAWIENFKATVLKKEKEAAKTSTDDSDKTSTKKKSETRVGDSGNPPENPDKDKADDKSTIEAAINNCKSPEELERLLAGLAKKGL